jgi:hypothetical protein
MSCRVVCILLVAGLIGLGSIHPQAALAGGPLRLFSKVPAAKAAEQHQPGPYGVSYGTPGPYRYPEYNSGNYPWYGYGFGVPTYNWGYFGAKYRPAVVSHKGYYDRYTQWGYRTGY